MSYESAYKEFTDVKHDLGLVEAISEIGRQDDSERIKQLPLDYRDDVACYVLFGHEPQSDLVRYVIENNLSGAMAFVNAKPWVVGNLCDLRLLTNYFVQAPVGCAGSRQTRQDWQDQGGLMGGEGKT